MRKENSSFNLNFLSQPGIRILYNNDYYGCSELDGFACYVVADGLLPGDYVRKDSSARYAVEAVIAAFNEAPSISKGALRKYLEAAHIALRTRTGKDLQRASIMVVVTDYKKLRYGYAGSCRFNLYRGGMLFHESKDHSVSWDMMEDGKLLKDKIAYHEERKNLKMYLGIKKGFNPSVSKKIKLRDTDVFSIFTRGIWENATPGDIAASIISAENDPAEASYYLERLILDMAPNTDREIENYTVCFVFVDKVYIDPKDGKRKKKIIIITIIVVLVIAIIIAAVIIYSNWRDRIRTDMQIAYHNGIEFIQGNNFTRAGEELQSAYDLAVRLRDTARRRDINNHIMLVDAVIIAEDLLGTNNYEQAIAAFDTAIIRARYVDNLALLYVESRRERAVWHMNVHEYIFLGDILTDINDWQGAESKFLNARSLASRIHYTEGRRKAIDSLEALFRAKEQDTEEQRQQEREQARQEVVAAEFIIQGDNAFRDGDLDAAELFFRLAKEQYIMLENEVIILSIDQKLALVELRRAQNEQMLEDAAEFMATANSLVMRREFIEARRFYLLARDIYASLGEEERLREVLLLIELVDLDLMQMNFDLMRQQQAAENEEAEEEEE